MKPDDLLKDYKAKRDFARTQEPAGTVGPSSGPGGRFVVQKHDATRLHYDFRLELDGVLKSWAVTKGPSANPADKRLAVRVEDHPLDYGDFEGTIPEGEYGGGTVMLWDEGTWEPLGDPHEGLESGDLKFTLKGKRLKGEWVLVHMKGRDQKTRHGQRENWLLIKHRDRYASDKRVLTEAFTTSVETGRDLDGIAKGLKSRRKAKRATAGQKQPAADAQVWSGGKAVALPEFRPPQLATLVDEVPAGRQWLFEMKYDGYRCLAALAGPEVRLYTRNGNDWTEQFHRLVQPLSTLTKGSALIDGEICAFKNGRTDFSTLKDALSNSGPLVYFAFDLLELDGRSLEALPLSERKQKLRALLGQIEADAEVQYSEHVQGSGEKVFAAMCEAGHEGVIAKLAASPYAHDRNRSWLKIKCLNRQEFVIAGWRPSDKKKTFASLLLGTWEDDKLIYRGRVGTGFNEASAAEIQAELDRLAADQPAFEAVPRDIRRQARWIRPELVGEVAYTEITPDGVLRHPSFLGLRQDKPAADVRRETPDAAPSRPPAKPATPAANLSDAAGIAAAKRLGVRLTHPERVVFPGQGVTKGNIVAYYEAVAGTMLPHLINRPLSLVRCPQGRSKHCFFQKHASGGFPDDLKQVPITEKDGGSEDYMYVEDLAGIIAGVQMNSLEFHIWGSRIDRLEKPDRIIFDIDPDEGLSFADVRQAAIDIRDRLLDMGLKTFPMVTGGKGIHVIAPLTARTEWPDIKAFCRGVAERLAGDEPGRFTANIRKVNRKGRMFIDYLRNERGSTAIAPYSTRSREGAPCAVPVNWDEVKKLERANGFSLAEAAVRAAGPDPWPDYFDIRQSITRKLLASVGAS